MAITCGFFNSLRDGSGNPDRTYTAEDMGRLFDGIITDGVYEQIGSCFAVTAPDNNMSILVGTGRCWFDHCWLLNDSVLRLDISTAYDLLGRYDTVVIEIDSSTSVRNATIKIVEGEPASSPVPPEMANTVCIHQYRIADIYVGPGVTSISDANIEYKVGFDATPYVTAPLQIVSSDAHWTRWYAELNEFTQQEETAFDTWFDGIKDILDENVAAQLLARIEALEAKEADNDIVRYRNNCSFNNDYFLIVPFERGTYPVVHPNILTPDSIVDIYYGAISPNSSSSCTEDDFIPKKYEIIETNEGQKEQWGVDYVIKVTLEKTWHGNVLYVVKVDNSEVK